MIIAQKVLAQTGFVPLNQTTFPEGNDDMRNVSSLESDDTRGKLPDNVEDKSEDNHSVLHHGESEDPYTGESNELPERDVIPPPKPYHYTLRPGYDKPRLILGSSSDLQVYAKNRDSERVPDGVDDPAKTSSAPSRSGDRSVSVGKAGGIPVKSTSLQAESQLREDLNDRHGGGYRQMNKDGGGRTASPQQDRHGDQPRQRYGSKPLGQGEDVDLSERHESYPAPDEGSISSSSSHGRWRERLGGGRGRMPGETVKNNRLRLSASPAGN